MYLSVSVCGGGVYLRPVQSEQREKVVKASIAVSFKQYQVYKQVQEFIKDQVQRSSKFFKCDWRVEPSTNQGGVL